MEKYANSLNSTAAFLLPQDPYAGVIKKYTSPSPGVDQTRLSVISM